MCQPDESFHHETPDWNPYLGNNYVVRIQNPNVLLDLPTMAGNLAKRLGL